MKIVVAVKVVPDDQDIFVSPDRSLDYSKAKPKISEYDKNALEAAAQFAAANDGSQVIAISAVPAKNDDTICGDGSADLYAGQVNIQLAAALGVPTINEVTSLTAEGDKLVVERTLDEEVEEIEVPLPAVVSVSPDIATPRIAGMRDILAAKKKPQTVEAAAVPVDVKVDVEEIKAPELAPRKNQIFEEGDIDAFVAAVAEALK